MYFGVIVTFCCWRQSSPKVYANTSSECFAAGVVSGSHIDVVVKVGVCSDVQSSACAVVIGAKTVRVASRFVV